MRRKYENRSVPDRLELAVAGAAEAIVTRNIRDFFLNAELRFPQIRIATSGQFLRSRR